MSLVNSRTPKAHPDEQHQGTYSLKPVSVFMFEEGTPVASFSPIEIGELLRFYGVDTVSELPPVAPQLEEPALADATTNLHPAASLSTAPEGWPTLLTSEQVAGLHPSKVVRKRVEATTNPRVVDACVILIDGLSEAHKESLFKRLATQLGYDIQ